MHADGLQYGVVFFAFRIIHLLKEIATVGSQQ